MHVREGGRVGAPTIVFLHGNGANGNMWDRHFEKCSDYHCLAPDYPGFGRSKGIEWVSLDDTTDRIIDVIHSRATGGQAHIVGLSLGGSIGINLLGKAPELIDHAIIDGSGVLPFPSKPFLTAGFFLIQPFMKTERLIRAIAKGLNIPAKEFERFKTDFQAMSPRAFRRSFSEGMGLKCPPGIERVTCPTLFVAGSREFRRFHESNLMMSKLMPHAECRVAPGMGHGWLAEAPDLHIRMVRAWIADEELPEELQKVN